jgi:hypothetical protein
MIRLRAPVPNLETTSILPSPQLGDVKNRRHEIGIFRAIDGTKRTFVKSNTRRLLTYDFSLSPGKAEELKRFIRSYYGSKIELRNHLDEIWHVYMVNNPFPFADEGAESVSVQLQFEGTQVS